MTFSDSRLVLANTESVCPDCLATVPAIRYAEGDTVFLEKTCPQHGTTSTPIWRGLKSYFAWDASPRNRSRVPKPATVVHEGLPPRLRPVPGSPAAKLLRASGRDLAL